MRKRKQWVKKKDTPLFVMQLFLHIHCSLGVFKAAHVPTDTGWWARILAASSWGLKRKRYPMSGYPHPHSGQLYHSVGCRVPPSLDILPFLHHLCITRVTILLLLTWEKALLNSKGLSSKEICAGVALFMVELLPWFHTYSVALYTTFLSWSPCLCA